MSGMEGVVAAVGGRLLASLAAPAAQALARKVWFRRKVARLVRRTVDFSCHWRTYRSWLRAITSEELGRPVEEVAGPLAVRLDAALMDASAEWQSRADHLSQALRLVEATYPAIAAALKEADARQQSETWAQGRSVVLRERLDQLAGPGAALSAGDLAAVLLRRSAARRSVRLQAFDLEEAILSAYFDRIAVPEVPVGQVVVLVGDFGAGKSEVAETWHRSTIEAFRTGAGAPPFPVWLRARDLGDQTLEGAIDRQVGHSWRQGRGACIVIDGLDETDVAAAQGLLESARILSKSHDDVQALLTARPGVVSAMKGERVETALISEEDAIALVELASGQPHATLGWTAEMRSTVRRPLFALAAGVMLGSEESPRGEADLIRSLVEGALSKGAERATVTSAETFLVLKGLAVASTRSGEDARLSFDERQVARSSRLVTDNSSDDVVTFSLPIFQHWFAAQAILDGTVEAREVVADAASFNRWRWAAAVAALSAPEPDTLDELMATWVTENPGAAGWIIKEAFSAHRTWRSADGRPLDAETSGARLLRALRTWADALGPLAPGVLPKAVVEGPVGLGVNVSGHKIGVALAVARPDADYVAGPPARKAPSASSSDWRSWFGGTAPEGDAWPWIVIRDQIADGTLRRLANDPYMGSPNGVWRQERRIDIARQLVGRGVLPQAVLLAGEVRTRATEVLGKIGQDGSVRLGSFRIAGYELQDLITWIDSEGTTEIELALPTPDVTHPSSGWVWDLYSPERLMKLEVEVYGRACVAYDEALTHTFAPLGWSMPSSVLQPFGVVLELEYQSDGSGDRTPDLTAVRAPMPLISQLAPSGPGVLWSTTGRAVISQVPNGSHDPWDSHSATGRIITSWLAEQHREPLSALSGTATDADDMVVSRPSASVAARWIWDDLQRLGLGSGMLSQLR